MPSRRAELPAVVSDSGRLLFVGAESELRDEVLRLAASTGITAQTVVATELVEALWPGPDLVLIDALCADLVSTTALSRRSGVLIVTSSRPGVDVWSAAVTIGVEQVLELPTGRTSLAERFSDVAGGSGPLGPLVAVIGGCGGVGASTLAVALALSAVRTNARPVLLGTDPWDGGIDLALGAEDVPGPRWPDLAGVSGRLSSPAILDGLPCAHEVRFLSSSRRRPARVPLQTLSAVVTAARRTGGAVIVDLPRGSDESASWLGRIADLGLVVCPATITGAMASRSLVTELGWTAATSGIVVRVEFGRDIDDDSLSAAVGLPVLARIRQDPRLHGHLQRGEPPGLRPRSSLAKSCGALWRLAAERRAVAA
ncbi:MAG: hypothetical protein H0T54_09845 [Geodermatophilaceae bacterium]|nr:hypothetical protein [Geodermatophilaceae bacterium]